MKKMIVFWKYDCFPYILSGESEGLTKTGFKVKGYGGYEFPKQIALFTLPKSKGERLQHQISTIAVKYRADVEELRKKAIEHRDDLISTLVKGWK